MELLLLDLLLDLLLLDQLLLLLLLGTWWACMRCA